MEICLVINETDIHNIKQKIIHYNNKTQLYEVRADYIKNLNSKTEIGQIRKITSAKLIFTIRKKSDGGLWQDRESERREIYQKAVWAGFDYIDLELETDFLPEQAGNLKIIRSYHNTLISMFWGVFTVILHSKYFIHFTILQTKIDIE